MVAMRLAPKAGGSGGFADGGRGARSADAPFLLVEEQYLAGPGHVHGNELFDGERRLLRL